MKQIHKILTLALFLVSCSISTETKNEKIISEGNLTETKQTRKGSGVTLDSGVVSEKNDKNKDCDADKLSDSIERGFGADPCKIDTDEDGLPDDFEIMYGYPFLDPTKKDTDQNNIDDLYEDNDKDGLINKTELELGTSPIAKDFDTDGLSDAVEMQFGSDWKKQDTDDDGLSDKIEYDWGLNPKINDSKKEGIYPVEYKINTQTGDIEQADIWIYKKGIAKDIDLCRGSIGKSPNNMRWGSYKSVYYEISGICESLGRVEKIAISQTGALKGYVPVFFFDTINDKELLDKGKITQEEAGMRLFTIGSSSKDRESADGNIYEYDIGDALISLGFTSNIEILQQEEENRINDRFQ